MYLLTSSPARPGDFLDCLCPARRHPDADRPHSRQFAGYLKPTPLDLRSVGHFTYTPAFSRARQAGNLALMGCAARVQFRLYRTRRA